MIARRQDLASSGHVLGRIDASRAVMGGGGLVVTCNPSRIGVQRYGNVNEYRDAAVVFDPASLETFRGLPAVWQHVDVDMANARSISLGYVRDARRSPTAPDWVEATLVLLDDDMIARVMRGDTIELSCAYDATIVPASGTFRGDAYQSAQRDLRMRHLALLDVGQARAGSGARVR